ncbi:Cytochrome c1-2, heme protein [Spatholobus suberectus]|nr:Cytochrome c1-2, heme protein [Spatholobus suberectus]
MAVIMRGEMFTRLGKLSDRFPRPYANKAPARFTNGRAYPPYISLITKARHNGQTYVFAFLTGYRDPLASVSIREGLHYNPYFPSEAIAMPKMINNGAMEYEDGTPTTKGQEQMTRPHQHMGPLYIEFVKHMLRNHKAWQVYFNSQ